MQSFESRPAAKQADLDSMGREAALDAASLNSSDDTRLFCFFVPGEETTVNKM